MGFDNSGGADQTLIVHWNGTAWTQLPSPSPGSVFSDLFGISAVSATSIWAVGDNSDGTDQTLILHWNGTTWKQVPSPSPGSKADDLLGVSATSSSNAWVVGLFSNGGPNQALALHCC